MSRLIVRNLPKYIKEQRLKSIFSKFGVITDIKLVYTKDGQFRRFAFIGYKTAQDANKTMEYYNNTFIDTCRVQVELAKSFLDSSLPKPWSKHTPVLEKPQEKQLVQKEEQEKQEKQGDAQLQEFLHVMGAKKKPTWDNDDVQPAPIVLPGDEDYQDLPTHQPMEESETETEDYAVVVEEKPQEHLIEKPRLTQMNPDRLRMMMGEEKANEILNQQGTVEPVNDTEGDKEEEKEEEEEMEMPSPVVNEPVPIEMIGETGRLMVRNLAYSCTPEELEELFKPFGPLSEVHIPIDKDTKLSKGYAFVLYLLPEHAVNAFSFLDKSIFQGRILEIVAAKEKPVAETTTATTFKAKREQDKKSTASKDYNWNSLFMNPDAIAESMATKLGVQKSDILDANADNMAVRLALAETTIINETKEYLRDHGVQLDSMRNSKKRSNNIILIKNIPSTTTHQELIDLFGKFGTLGRVLLPPARTIALIEFTERNEAKSAFRRLAYSKFKELPLYLEWAPVETFKEEYDPEKHQQIPVEIKQEEVVVEEEEETPVATIFVKNLNFNTKDEDLKKAFDSLPGLRSARVATKTDPKTRIKKSMGFGFLEFQNKDQAKECMKTMQKFKLDGHELQLKFSTNNTQTASEKRKRQEEEEPEGTKLIIRNVPFEATKRDIKELFSSFGQVKSLRLPKKYDGQHRGFAFCDFLTKQEAKKAFEALSSTHLYGRHLVIEWAKEETLDDLRLKTEKRFKE